MGSSGAVEVINSKGCLSLFVAAPASLPPASLPSINSSRSSCLMSPASMAVSKPGAGFPRTATSGPFAGLVICVTGLSKEARKQVMDATERLGGQYSASLHPQCTHLVVQSFGGRKFEHALKHGLKNGLFVITLGWLVDSVRRNVRMSETLYAVKCVGESGLPLQELNHLVNYRGLDKSCLPIYEDRHRTSTTWQPHLPTSEKETLGNRGPILTNKVIHIDSNVPNDLKKKVVDAAVREGATFIDQWFVGCQASHVVCEGPYIHKYIGHANNLVTPLWILKSVKENYVHRLVHVSKDLARHIAVTLDNVQISLAEQDASGQNAYQATRESISCRNSRKGVEDRQKIVDMAKNGVRNRRSVRLRTCQITIRPITPSSLLDSICWSISDPASLACIYMDCHGKEDVNETHAPAFFNASADNRDLDASFSNVSRPLKESEKREVIFKNHFLTILFPIDRFGELGPSSRTFFREGGFTCLQLLEHVYNFYQENMTAEEIDVAIHTDSKHADGLRSLYASKEIVDPSLMQFKRIDFLGSRRSFEVLKRVSGENNCNVYELMIRA
uniref:DNA topoisomerase 2-binding protein 1 n=1 Tax=Anthurium amnicola TaxID=1678845 RepID=A0A1D1Y567_9ARAE